MATNNYGLDPNLITNSTKRGDWTEDYNGVGGHQSGHQVTADQHINTYNGPGGQWTQTANTFGNDKNPQYGAWTSASGVQMQDLPGYLKMRQQQTQGADFSGYQTGVNNALNSQNQANQDYQSLLKDPSKIQQTAGYQFSVDQGNQAINRSAAAKGMSNSGGVLAELAKYGQGMASQQYQQQLGNFQQNFQNQGTQLNSLTGLMQGAQNFGVNSGYYNPAQYTPSLGINGGGHGSVGSGGGGGRTTSNSNNALYSNYTAPNTPDKNQNDPANMSLQQYANYRANGGMPV